MPKLSSKSDFHFHKAVQISESHCGPAVLHMLLSHIGISVNQRTFTKAARAVHTIAKHGIHVGHMTRAINTLKLDAIIWYKLSATVTDIRVLLETYGYPVGVQWQGLFEDDEDDFDYDYGHYSVVTRVGKRDLVIVDPYKDYAKRDRVIRIATFLKRWWDENTIRDPASGKKHKIKDAHLLFVVTPPSTTFPRSLGLIKGSLYVQKAFS